MKTALLAMAILAFPLAACDEKTCTPEALQTKHKDLQDAMTAALAKNPVIASDPQAWSKALDLMARTQSAGSSPSEDLCKAYDAQIEAVRRQNS